MMYSAHKFNKQGDNIKPWRTPLPIWNQSVVPCLVLTVASWPAYRCLRRQVRWPGIPTSKNFPQFVEIHTVKGFSVVNEAEVGIFWNSFDFFYDPTDVGNLILVPLPFLNPAGTSGTSQFMYYWCLAWRILSITLLACEWVEFADNTKERTSSWSMAGRSRILFVEPFSYPVRQPLRHLNSLLITTKYCLTPKIQVSTHTLQIRSLKVRKAKQQIYGVLGT